LKRGLHSLLILVAALATGCAEDSDSTGSTSLPHAAPPAASAGGFRIAPPFRWADSASPEAAPAPLAVTPGASNGSVASPALEHGAFGLFPARQFRIATPGCTDCGAPAAVLWYFRNELAVVPRDAAGPSASSGRGASASSSRGASASASSAGSELPAVVWLGAPEIIDGAIVADDGSSLGSGGTELPLFIAPRLPANTAYADRSTLRFFAGRTVRARGATRIADGRAVFVARTLWPSDARIDVRRLEPRPLRGNELLATLVEGEWGGRSEGRFPARLLYERRGATRDWAGKAVLAFVLSGAQGDDDGSRAGHLAIGTGRFGLNGEWRDWLVDDFYPLEPPNPKGIVSAPVPMDNYLFDFNSGQLYYRPAYMLVAVLRDEAVAFSVQRALQSTMLRYYCRAFDFDLARHNSTALSIDPLRALGWRIPEAGPTSVLAALLAAPLVALAQGSVASGEAVYAGLAQEQTRLLPRVAFEALGDDLLSLLAQGGRPGGAATEFERRLIEDVEAVLFVRLPQVPSSRRVGTYPERSLIVYAARLLTDRGPYERPDSLAPEPIPHELAASCSEVSQERNPRAQPLR
jgi:hypothetical protein